MIRKFIALTIILFSFLTAYTQSDTTSMKSGFYYGATNKYCNFRGLNNAMRNAGIPELENNIMGFSLGLTSRYYDKNSYSSSTLTLFEVGSLDKENNNKKAKITILELAIEMHWVISKSSKWFIYPCYGLGLSASKLKLTETVNNLNFNQSVSDLSIDEKYTKEYFTDNPLFFANVGLGLDRKIQIQNYDFYIGFSLGYRLSTRSTWNYEDSPFIDYSGLEYKIIMRLELDKNRKKHPRSKYYKYFN